MGPHASGRRRRAPLFGAECLYQNIILEALTQPGDLFYDASFGWGLYDFIQSEDDDLVRFEIAQRARLGLQKREVIVPESIEIDVGFSDDTFRLRCSFQFADEEEPRELNVVISAVGVEVITTGSTRQYSTKFSRFPSLKRSKRRRSPS